MAHNTMEFSKRTFDIQIDENIDFSSFMLSHDVLQGLQINGFNRPSPVQLKAIPLGKCGVDLIVQAKSGTGKTCVFTIIALEMLSQSAKGIQVLILVPTREIAVQVLGVVKAIGCAMQNLVCHAFIGGTQLDQDIKNLEHCQIAVGTPGRIKALIENKNFDAKSIRLLVLDEADKLLEPGSFQEQINWIFSTLPSRKQVLALSATYPEYLRDHLSNYTNEPLHVRVNNDTPTLLGIEQYYVIVSHHHLPHIVFESKAEKLALLLSQVSFQQCLVFSNYHTRAEYLAEKLSKRGWPVAFIAGKQTQNARLNAMQRLRDFQCRILISTDLTSRGIDCDKVDLVINLDLPWDTETYLHRIGRAGRFGNYGIALSLVAQGCEVKKLQNIANEIKYEIKEFTGINSGEGLDGNHEDSAAMNIQGLLYKDGIINDGNTTCAVEANKAINCYNDACSVTCEAESAVSEISAQISRDNEIVEVPGNNSSSVNETTVSIPRDDSNVSIPDAIGSFEVIESDSLAREFVERTDVSQAHVIIDQPRSSQSCLTSEQNHGDVRRTRSTEKTDNMHEDDSSCVIFKSESDNGEIAPVSNEVTGGHSLDEAAGSEEGMESVGVTMKEKLVGLDSEKTHLINWNLVELSSKLLKEHYEVQKSSMKNETKLGECINEEISLSGEEVEGDGSMDNSLLDEDLWKVDCEGVVYEERLSFQEDQEEEYEGDEVEEATVRKNIAPNEEDHDIIGELERELVDDLKRLNFNESNYENTLLVGEKCHASEVVGNHVIIDSSVGMEDKPSGYWKSFCVDEEQDKEERSSLDEDHYSMKNSSDEDYKYMTNDSNCFANEDMLCEKTHCEKTNLKFREPKQNKYKDGSSNLQSVTMTSRYGHTDHVGSKQHHGQYCNCQASSMNGHERFIKTLHAAYVQQSDWIRFYSSYRRLNSNRSAWIWH
eukprot:gene5996-6692_t